MMRIRRRTQHVDINVLLDRQEFLQKSFRKAQDIAALKSMNPKGWEGFKNVIREKIAESDGKLDAHMGMTADQKTSELSTRVAFRAVLNISEDMEFNMKDLQLRMENIKLEIRKARERVGEQRSR